jgi:hypothetical protein
VGTLPPHSDGRLMGAVVVAPNQVKVWNGRNSGELFHDIEVVGGRRWAAGALPQWRSEPERRHWRSRESDKGGEVALKIKQGREDRARCEKERSTGPVRCYVDPIENMSTQSTTQNAQASKWDNTIRSSC